MVLPIGLDANGRLVEIPSGSSLLPLGIDAAGRFVEIGAGGNTPRIGIGDNGQLIELASATAPRLLTPADLTSAPLIARWKVGEKMTLVDGKVDRWDSMVGSAFAYAETAARRPTFNAQSAIDGRPEIRGGNGLRLKVSTKAFPTGDAAFTMMVVAASDGADNQNVAFGWGDDYQSCRQMQFKVDRIITVMGGAEIHSEFSTVNRWRTGIGMGGGGSPEIVEIRHTGQSVKTASVNMGPADNDAFIFARPNFGDRYLFGAIREINVYAGALNNADVAALQGYAAWDNGTVGDLPSSHPNKTAAPTVPA